jgi:rod shape-determining protein MreD
VTDRSNVLRLAGLLVVVAVLQAAVVSWLNVAGYVPDLLLVVAVAAGAVGGVDRGPLIGFAAGLLTDLMVTTPMGMWALVGCIAATASGTLAGSAAMRGAGRRALVFAGVAAGSTLLFVVLARLLDQGALGAIDVFAAALVNGLAAGTLSRTSVRAVRWTFGYDAALERA